MSVTYTYSVATDTASGALDSDALTEEIVTAALGQALENVGRIGDVLSITFAAALTSGDQTALTAVVAAHTATKPNKIISETVEPYGRRVRVTSKVVTTNTATPKVVHNLSLAGGELARISVCVLAKRTDAVGFGRLDRVMLASKASGQDSTLGTVLADPADDVPLASGWDCTVVINAGDDTVRVRVTGNAVHTVRWYVEYDARIRGIVT